MAIAYHTNNTMFSNIGEIIIHANFTANNNNNMTSFPSSSSSTPATGQILRPHSDFEQEKAILNQVDKYASTLVILFGIITNILTLLTLRDPELKKAPYSYLTALAVADLSALLLALSLYITKFLEQYISYQSYEYCWYMSYFYYPLINLASTTGTFIMTTMTIERCLFIKFPFWVLAHKSRARIKIGCVFLASFVITFPRFLWYCPKRLMLLPQTLASNYNSTSGGGNSTAGEGVGVYMIALHLHGSHFAMVITWIHSVVLQCLPVVILILLNAFLIYKFRFEHRRRSELGISSTMSTVWGREQTRLTYTYSIITGAFIVLIMPSAFADENISKALFGANRQAPSIVVLQFVSNFLVLVNLSLNFLMYTFINIKFTRAFKMMMFRWRMRARSILFCCTLESRRRARMRHEQFKMTMTSEEKVPFNNNKNSAKNHILRQQYQCRQTISRNGTSFTTLSDFRIDVT